MKTISVYDAVKLATKGPLHHESKSESYSNPSIRCECGSMVAMSYELANHGCTKDNGLATVAVLAHFFNHGPALLAMLEEFVKLYEPFRKQLDANETEILDESIALIAKASKVEIEE